MKNINVDFDFIHTLEGGMQLEGYVPDLKYSKSGVTIASGFDLGQTNLQALRHLLPPSIVKKFKPYIGLKGKKAQEKLNIQQLRISEKEAQIIDACLKTEFINWLSREYQQHSQYQFPDLTQQMQTVIASVAFQYGDLAKRCPKFWRAAIAADVDAMQAELRDFGDRYPTRRNKEADLLFKGECYELV